MCGYVCDVGLIVYYIHFLPLPNKLNSLILLYTIIHGEEKSNIFNLFIAYLAIKCMKRSKRSCIFFILYTSLSMHNIIMFYVYVLLKQHYLYYCEQRFDSVRYYTFVDGSCFVLVGFFLWFCFRKILYHDSLLRKIALKERVILAFFF